MALTFENQGTGVFTFGGPLDMHITSLSARLSFPSNHFPCVINLPHHLTNTLFFKPHLTLASDTAVAGTTTNRAHISAAPEPTPQASVVLCGVMLAPCQAGNSRHPA